MTVEEFEVEVVPDATMEAADLGDILLIPEDQVVPDHWHLCDGSIHPSGEWPDFAFAVGIQGPVFTIPMPQQTLPGHRFVIKLGERSEPL